MSPKATGSHTQAITLIASDRLEESQARIWRPVSTAWPSFADPPTLQVLPMQDAALPIGNLLGAAALITFRTTDDPATLFKLLDRLTADATPAVVLFEEFDERAGALARSGVIAMPWDTPPAIIAATLSALARRQDIVDSMHAEIRMSKRFQGGICGEMDKIHEELQLAASVQREFLPKSLPQVPNIDFRVLFRPCGYVSGDIYDVQRLDEHRVGFFVADAVGHGVPAALMTMVLTRSVSMKTVVGDGYALIPPAEVLQRLNTEMIRRHGDTPRFATAVYGIVDCRDRSIRLAGAGHPPPLVIGPRGTRRIETSGGLLGVFAEDTFNDVSFALEPDEMLIIYSDGLETAFPSPEADDHGRRLPTVHYLDHFTAMAETWKRHGLTAAFRQLATNLDRQSGSLHQIDDLTVLGLVPSMDRDLDSLFSGIAKGAAEEQSPGRSGLHSPSRAGSTPV